MNVLPRDFVRAAIRFGMLLCVLLTDRASAAGLVEVTNDSPALIGTPITFSVLLSERVTPPLFYRIYFKDDLNIVDTYLDARGSITKQFVYDSKIDPNHAHVMNVTVEMWIVFFPMWIVGGSVLSSFKLTEDIHGTISITQSEVPKRATDLSLISSGTTATFELSVHDPTKALIDLDYQWLINDSRCANQTQTKMDHQFVTVGNYTVTTIVTGKVARNNVTHEGSIVHNVTVLDPITDVEKHGHTSIVRDHNLKLSFNIQGGSPLYWFCYAILPNNQSILPCDNPIVTPNRTIQLEKYFREPGSFYLKLCAGNDVSKIEREIQINVDEFVRKPQLSVIVIPIVCSILALTIVVFGVAYHVNHRNNYTIETADFDFQKHNMEELLEKTFFERMRDTFLNSVRTLFMCDFAHFRWRRMTEDNTDATRNSADDDENVSDDVGSPVRELQLSSPLESVPSYSASSNSSPFSQYNGIVNSGLDVTEETTTIRSKNKRSKKNLKRRIDRDSGVHSDIDQKAS